MENINIDDLVTMYNNGMSLVQIAEKVGLSKTTIQRNIVKDGYVRNNETKKYEKNVSHETNINCGTNNIESNNSSDTIKNEEQEKMVNRTYAISEKIERAMKIKSAIEGKKPVDIVREALQNYIDDKYFDM